MTDQPDDPDASYSVELTRRNADGSVSRIAVSDYALLHELLEALIAAGDRKGWLREPVR
jgi:hypothetical protein